MIVAEPVETLTQFEGLPTEAAYSIKTSELNPNYTELIHEIPIIIIKQKAKIQFYCAVPVNDKCLFALHCY